MNNRNNDNRTELVNAHNWEMNEPAAKSCLKFKMISQDRIKAAQIKYATMCAEYAACKGIYVSYHVAGLDEIADSFATGATVAGESARAAGEILDILGVEHVKL